MFNVSSFYTTHDIYTTRELCSMSVLFTPLMTFILPGSCVQCQFFLHHSCHLHYQGVVSNVSSFYITHVIYITRESCPMSVLSTSLMSFTLPGSRVQCQFFLHHSCHLHYQGVVSNVSSFYTTHDIYITREPCPMSVLSAPLMTFTLPGSCVQCQFFLHHS